MNNFENVWNNSVEVELHLTSNPALYFASYEFEKNDFDK